VHAEGAFLFGRSGTSAITESLTGQALSLIYTPTTPVDLETPGLRDSERLALSSQNVMGVGFESTLSGRPPISIEINRRTGPRQGCTHATRRH
jgi:hypothetical protein